MVDDGNTDSTSSVVETLASSASEIQLLPTSQRRGKGAAVRRGRPSAVERLQLFADADGTTPIQELARLEQAVATGADIAIGSRALASQLPGYRAQTRGYRSILTTLFNSLVQQRSLKGITDTQCGFKLFRQKVAADLLKSPQSTARSSISSCSMSCNSADTASQKFRRIGLTSPAQSFTYSKILSRPYVKWR